MSLPFPTSAESPVFFFFSSRRRHTRFDCDWSSDVCSSDLGDHTRDRHWSRPRQRSRSVVTAVLHTAPRQRHVPPEVLRVVKQIEIKARILAEDRKSVV